MIQDFDTIQFNQTRYQYEYLEKLLIDLLSLRKKFSPNKTLKSQL